MTNTVRIYGCGGCGTNIANKFAGRGEQNGHATLVPTVIDTSKSNLRGKDIAPENTYLFEGLDGSGKVRKENYQEINRNVKQMLVDLPPEQYNLVVFSASGGSGSVIAPLIIQELAKKGKPVMAIVVGSDESIIAANNTLKTLQSLEAIAEAVETPVVMSYHHNDDARSVVDNSIVAVIDAISVLFSGMNNEMDHMDAVHWLNYTKSVNVRPRLATLLITTSPNSFEEITAPISVASLYVSPDTKRVSTSADYHTEAFSDMAKVAGSDQIHYAIDIDTLAKIGQAIKSTVAELEEKRSARVEPDNLRDANSQSNESNLVL